MKRITSRQNPTVRRYRDAARRTLPDVLLLDGPHLVGEALSSGIPIQHAVVRADAVDDPEISTLVAALERCRADLAAASMRVMAAVSPVRSPSPIAALAEPPSGGRVRMYAGAVPLVVVACDVQDPGNVGALVRVAEAGGASGVITAGQSADPFGWKALRGSMGSTLRVPISTFTVPAEAVADARAHGCRIVVAVPRNGRLLFDVELTGPIAVLLGGEGAGLSGDLIQAADEQVTIPMMVPVESLNTAVTAGLFIYEAWRQRVLR